MSKYLTKWTGRYPVLCHGTWLLYKDGKNISNLIPEDLQDAPMGCAGWFQEWSFVNGWEEEWNTYHDGLSADEWIEENEYWLKEIGPEEDYKDIFYAFQENDWRGGSCGGCI